MVCDQLGGLTSILGLENQKVGELLHIEQSYALRTRGIERSLPCSRTIREQVVERICIKLPETWQVQIERKTFLSMEPWHW